MLRDWEDEFLGSQYDEINGDFDLDFNDVEPPESGPYENDFEDYWEEDEDYIEDDFDFDSMC